MWCRSTTSAFRTPLVKYTAKTTFPSEKTESVYLIFLIDLHKLQWSECKDQVKNNQGMNEAL